MDGYAIISVGGKQYRVHEGQRLLVDRLRTDEGKTFTPDVLLLGGNGKPDLSPRAGLVTARVVGHVRGDKIRIGKYRPKSGYRRHTGFRASLSQIEIESIGGMKRAEAARPAKPKEETQDAAPPAPKGLPKDYEGMTVAQVADAAPGWRRPQLEAALEHERAQANRKGAVAALESALAAKEES
jgi:large subunit ribosomal protein L21